MKRALVLAAAGLCAAAAAHAQSTWTKHQSWEDSSKEACLEPYAPAVPKAEKTTLKELVEDVKPDIEKFLTASNKYLECLAVQIDKAQKDKDAERLTTLVKAYNENVDYQKSVAGEFNTVLTTKKGEEGLAAAKPNKAGQKKDGAQDDASTKDSKAPEKTESSKDSKGSEASKASEDSKNAKGAKGSEEAKATSESSGKKTVKKDKAEQDKAEDKNEKAKTEEHKSESEKGGASEE